MSYTTIHIQETPHERITEEVIRKTDLLVRHIALTANIVQEEQDLAKILEITPRQITRWKKELRELFKIPARSSIAHLANHPKIRQACISILARKERTDKLQLRGAKGLYVVATSGELITVENYLIFLFRNPDNPAALHCYTSLIGRWKNKMVVNEEGNVPAFSELPSSAAVCRWIKDKREEDILIKLGHLRKADLNKQLGYVTRDKNEFAVGEVLVGDHTEHPWELFNEDTGKIEHWWVTIWIDMRSGLITGYEHCKTPSSNSIALAFRNSVLGNQLYAIVANDSGNDEFKKVSVNVLPQELIIDNGKDYRSNYNQQIFGRIDFTDEARRGLDLSFTKIHYAEKYHPQTKGNAEVWFRTYQRILKYLPAFRGSNYSRKPESNAVDIKENNIVSVKTFQKLFFVAVTTYNNRHRRDLKMSPLQFFLTHYNFQRTIDIRALDFLLHKVQHRKVENSEITLLKNLYYNKDLITVNGKYADIYYDPNDLGYVSVYVEGKFIAVAMNKQMINQTERGWLKILNERKAIVKQVQTSIKDATRGLSGIDAKYDLLAGQLMNTNAMPMELAEKKFPTVFIKTGLEENAKEIAEAKEHQELLAEIERDAKKHKKVLSINSGNVGNLF